MVGTTATAFAGPPPHPHPHTIAVGPGDSIQAALDGAQSGDTIVVRGTHHEQVTILTDRIHLIGVGGAAIVAPAAELPFGVFVGDGDPDTQTINHTVRGVHISGFSISGFGIGIFTFGAADTVIEHTTAFGNDEYGFFTNTSTGTTFRDDTASGSGEAATTSATHRRPGPPSTASRRSTAGGDLRRAAEGVEVRRANLLAKAASGCSVLAGTPDRRATSMPRLADSVTTHESVPATRTTRRPSRESAWRSSAAITSPWITM